MVLSFDDVEGCFLLFVCFIYGKSQFASFTLWYIPATNSLIFYLFVYSAFFLTNLISSCFFHLITICYTHRHFFLLTWIVLPLNLRVSKIIYWCRFFIADNILDEIIFGWPRQRAGLQLRELLASRLQKAMTSVSVLRNSNEQIHYLSILF